MSRLISHSNIAVPNRFRLIGRARAHRLALRLALGLLVSQLASISAMATDRSVILATTTSVRDSGLLEAILPDFEKRTGIEVRVIAVGTGAALRMGREGDVDLLLTHAPAAEMKLVEEGVVTRRTPFMENFFVIAGPAEDPARVGEASSPSDAIRRVARTRSRWVSRADDSGTHKKEKSLFRAAGLKEDEEWEGLDRTGTGMGLSLQVAGEFRAYILSDIGTFLAFQDRTHLVVLSHPADSLRNVYSILQLDSTRFDRPLATSAARELERYFLDEDTQDRIGRFGLERFGRPLFMPLHPASEAVAPTSPGAPTRNQESGH